VPRPDRMPPPEPAQGATKPVAGLTLRPLVSADIPAAHRLSQAVGWLHRAEDWDFALGLGHGIAAVADGEIRGTAFWWPYGEGYATLGLIIVSPQHQGAGIGKVMMQALLDQAGTRTLMLNATPQGVPLYEKNGFRPGGEIHQHQGVLPASPPPALAAHEAIRFAAMPDLPVLARLDADATGLERRHVLERLLQVGEAIVLERNGEPAGFAVLRPFGRGLTIGPVVAADEDAARLLVSHWLHEQRGQFVRIDVTGGSGLGDWLGERGLPRVGVVSSMTRGVPPAPMGPTRLFALVNQALG
jgi:GNAT superfamily N-acetyltransferase